MKYHKDIFEIIFFARGGQGAKSAAEILAQAAVTEGKFVQAFPVAASNKLPCGQVTTVDGVTQVLVVVFKTSGRVQVNGVTVGVDPPPPEENAGVVVVVEELLLLLPVATVIKPSAAAVKYVSLVCVAAGEEPVDPQVPER